MQDLKQRIEKKIGRKLQDHDFNDLIRIVDYVLQDFDYHDALHQIVIQMQKLEGHKK